MNAAVATQGVAKSSANRAIAHDLASSKNGRRVSATAKFPTVEPVAPVSRQAPLPEPTRCGCGALIYDPADLADPVPAIEVVQPAGHLSLSEQLLIAFGDLIRRRMPRS